MRKHVSKRIAGAVAVGALALAIGAIAVPASAISPTDGALNLYSGDFAGQSLAYGATTSGCTALPFAVHSELNLSERSFQIYSSTDCTGYALGFPVEDIHSFAGFDGRSIRFVG